MKIKHIIAITLLAITPCALGEETPAYQLASLDAGKHIPKDDVRVEQYQRHLTKIATMFKITETQIGDMTFVTAKRLREKKIATSIFEILVGMSQQTEAAELGVSYAESLALLTTIMEANHNK